MADFEIRELGGSEIGIKALTERAQQSRRLAQGVTIAFKSPGDALEYVEAAEAEGYSFAGRDLLEI